MENKYYYKCDRELINKAMEITCVSYEVEKEYLPIEKLELIIEDLVYEYNVLKEKYDDVIEDRNENWKQIEYKDQI